MPNDNEPIHDVPARTMVSRQRGRILGGAAVSLVITLVVVSGALAAQHGRATRYARASSRHAHIERRQQYVAKMTNQPHLSRSQMDAMGSHFPALRRTQTAADVATISKVKSALGTMVKTRHLDVSATRALLAPSTNALGITTALVPGSDSNTLCFVAMAPSFGSIISCLPSTWADSHNGFGFVGTLGGQNVTVGLLPDTFNGIAYQTESNGTVSVPLNSENAYATVLPSAPVNVILSGVDGSTTTNAVPAQP
jgi:hypothetical protein